MLKLWAHRTALAVHREFTGAAGYKLFGHRLRSLSYCGFASLRSLPYVNSTIQPEEDIAKSKHCLHRVNSLIQQLMDQYIYLSTVSYRMGQVKPGGWRSRIVSFDDPENLLTWVHWCNRSARIQFVFYIGTRLARIQFVIMHLISRTFAYQICYIWRRLVFHSQYFAVDLFRISNIHPTSTQCAIHYFRLRNLIINGMSIKWECWKLPVWCSIKFISYSFYL